MEGQIAVPDMEGQIAVPDMEGQMPAPLLSKNGRCNPVCATAIYAREGIAGKCYHSRALAGIRALL
jgi:hypothetical protein